MYIIVGEHAKLGGGYAAFFKIFRSGGSKAGMPVSKCLLQLSFKYPDAQLQEQMGSLRTPLHLLPPGKALGDE